MSSARGAGPRPVGPIVLVEPGRKGRVAMITITSPDREAEKRALAYLIGRFSGRVLRSGEHLVPEAALDALADQNIPFTVKGKTNRSNVGW